MSIIGEGIEGKYVNKTEMGLPSDYNGSISSYKIFAGII